MAFKKSLWNTQPRRASRCRSTGAATCRRRTNAEYTMQWQPRYQLSAYRAKALHWHLHYIPLAADGCAKSQETRSSQYAVQLSAEALCFLVNPQSHFFKFRRIIFWLSVGKRVRRCVRHRTSLARYLRTRRAEFQQTLADNVVEANDERIRFWRSNGQGQGRYKVRCAKHQDYMSHERLAELWQNTHTRVYISCKSLIYLLGFQGHGSKARSQQGHILELVIAAGRDMHSDALVFKYHIIFRQADRSENRTL